MRTTGIMRARDATGRRYGSVTRWQGAAYVGRKPPGPEPPIAPRRNRNPRRFRKSANSSACRSQANQCFTRCGSCRRGLRHDKSVVAAARQPRAEHRAAGSVSAVDVDRITGNITLCPVP